MGAVQENFDWLPAEEQDWVLAETLIDMREDGASVSNLGDVCSALAKF